MPTRTRTRTRTATRTGSSRRERDTYTVRLRRPRPTYLIAKWAARHTADAARWARAQAGSAARSERERARTRYADWNDSRDRFGNRPWIYDASTGEKYDARHPEMFRHLDAIDSPDAQDRRERDHGFREDVEAARLSRWDRLKIRMRIVETDPDDVEQRRFLKRRAGLRGIQNTTSEPAPALPGRPTPAPAAPAAIGGSTHMANSVKEYSDLHDPGIDPFEYPEELPQHLAEVQALIANGAAEYDELAEEERKKAEALRAYADYMESAEVVADVIGPIREAADKAEEIAAQLAKAAELMGSIADDLAAAQRAAEAEYGDQQVPRFDKAN